MLDCTDRSGWRRCIECSEPSLDLSRGFCPKCYMRNFRRRNRIKARTCACCGAPFSATCRDARYCSPTCRQLAHRAGDWTAAVVEGRAAAPRCRVRGSRGEGRDAPTEPRRRPTGRGVEQGARPPGGGTLILGRAFFIGRRPATSAVEGTAVEGRRGPAGPFMTQSCRRILQESCGSRDSQPA